jgi:hypothetical protein
MRRTVALNTESADTRLPQPDSQHVQASTIPGKSATRNSVTIGVILRIRIFRPRTLGTCGTFGTLGTFGTFGTFGLFVS